MIFIIGQIIQNQLKYRLEIFFIIMFFVFIFLGTFEPTKKFIESLLERKIFVRELDSSQIPYHSVYMGSSAQKMTEILHKIIKKPKMRSNKWISTSILNVKEDKEKYASAEYFVNNLLNPVYFHNKFMTLPENAIVIEIGPHALFAHIIPKTLESANYVPLIKKDQNNTNLEHFLLAIGKLYQLGVNPSIEKLYGKVEFPVSRGTQSISSIMKWDHKLPYAVRKFPEYHNKATASDMIFVISLANPEYEFLADHCVDGKVIFPATGYLMLAWRRLAMSRCQQWTKVPVIFEDVQFRRPIFLSVTDTTKLTVRLFEPSGNYLNKSDLKSSINS
jgi:fatty acid synthase